MIQNKIDNVIRDMYDDFEFDYKREDFEDYGGREVPSDDSLEKCQDEFIDYVKESLVNVFGTKRIKELKMIEMHNDYLLVDLIGEKNKTNAGIYVPTKDVNVARGIVKSGKIEGSEVIFPKNAKSYTDVRIEDKDFVVVKCDEIIGSF